MSRLLSIVSYYCLKWESGRGLLRDYEPSYRPFWSTSCQWGQTYNFLNEQGKQFPQSNFNLGAPAATRSYPPVIRSPSVSVCLVMTVIISDSPSWQFLQYTIFLLRPSKLNIHLIWDPWLQLFMWSVPRLGGHGAIDTQDTWGKGNIDKTRSLLPHPL